MGRACIGTSGWIYDSWRSDFYDARPAQDWLAFSAGRFGFEALEVDGSVHSVPFHRVRAVWRDGELIWSRPAR